MHRVHVQNKQVLSKFCDFAEKQARLYLRFQQMPNHHCARDKEKERVHCVSVHFSNGQVHVDSNQQARSSTRNVPVNEKLHKNKKRYKPSVQS